MAMSDERFAQSTTWLQPMQQKRKREVSVGFRRKLSRRLRSSSWSTEGFWRKRGGGRGSRKGRVEVLVDVWVGGFSVLIPKASNRAQWTDGPTVVGMRERFRRRTPRQARYRAWEDGHAPGCQDAIKCSRNRTLGPRRTLPERGLVAPHKPSDHTSLSGVITT